MSDPGLETVIMVVFATVIGLLVFGGTTLIHFRDKHRRLPAKPAPVQARAVRSEERRDPRAA